MVQQQPRIFPILISTYSFARIFVALNGPLSPYLAGAPQSPAPHSIHVTPGGFHRSESYALHPEQLPCLIRCTILNPPRYQKLHHTQKPKNLFKRDPSKYLHKQLIMQKRNILYNPQDKLSPQQSCVRTRTNNSEKCSNDQKIILAQ